MTVRRVARDAAVAALSTRPGQHKIDRAEQSEIVRLQGPGCPFDVDLTVRAAPILLAVSDNGPEMRSDSTRTFMALVIIGQHFGRLQRVIRRGLAWRLLR